MVTINLKPEIEIMLNSLIIGEYKFIISTWWLMSNDIDLEVLECKI